MDCTMSIEFDRVNSPKLPNSPLTSHSDGCSSNTVLSICCGDWANRMEEWDLFSSFVRERSFLPSLSFACHNNVDYLVVLEWDWSTCHWTISGLVVWQLFYVICWGDYFSCTSLCENTIYRYSATITKVNKIGKSKGWMQQVYLKNPLKLRWEKGKERKKKSRIPSPTILHDFHLNPNKF